jgi:hypothetical protein
VLAHSRNCSTTSVAILPGHHLLPRPHPTLLLKELFLHRIQLACHRSVGHHVNCCQKFGFGLAPFRRLILGHVILSHDTPLGLGCDLRRTGVCVRRSLVALGPKLPPLCSGRHGDRYAMSGPAGIAQPLDQSPRSCRRALNAAEHFALGPSMNMKRGRMSAVPSMAVPSEPQWTPAASCHNRTHAVQQSLYTGCSTLCLPQAEPVVAKIRGSPPHQPVST